MHSVALLVFPLLLLLGYGHGKAIDLQDISQFQPFAPNFCNDSVLLVETGLRKTSLGQFLGYPCSQEFFQCRRGAEGFRTFKKTCLTGLVFDTEGTQNCNYDYNVGGCSLKSSANVCKKTEFACRFSESCVSMAQRCDGTYDCTDSEDEINCPMCTAGEFACLVSEQCIGMHLRCNGVSECADGTDEMNCEKCGNGGFYCAKSDECVGGDQRCDGIPQCASGEDEALCKAPSYEKLYTCEDRLQTVAMKNVCDGNSDCRDGSDEKYCTKPSITSFSSLSSVAPKQNGRKQNHRIASYEEDNPLLETAFPAVRKPMFPVVPSASLPTSGISTNRAFFSRPPPQESERDVVPANVFSAYSIPQKSIRSGLTNSMDKEQTRGREDPTHKEFTSATVSRPVFPLKKATVIPSVHSPATAIPQKVATNRGISSTPLTLTSQPSTEKIPSYTGQSGRKNFFLERSATKEHRAVIEVTSRPPTSTPPKETTELGEDDIVRQIAQMAKSNKNSARDLLHKIENMLSARPNQRSEVTQSITVTRPPSRKWRPSLSHIGGGATASPSKTPTADRRLDVFMRQYDTVTTSAAPLESAESAFNATGDSE